MKALVLAGGYPQIALINELKSRGITVLLADYYASPVAKPYADAFYQVSTLDIEAITDLAREKQVDFLITACTDQALLTVAKVSQTLGLPCYIDYKTALNVTNKSYMKEVFRENGISTAKHLSSSILLFIGGVASIYTCLVAKDKSVVKLNNIAKMFGDSIKTIAPAISVCVFGYMIGSCSAI